MKDSTKLSFLRGLHRFTKSLSSVSKTVDLVVVGRRKTADESSNPGKAHYLRTDVDQICIAANRRCHRERPCRAGRTAARPIKNGHWSGTALATLHDGSSSHTNRLQPRQLRRGVWKRSHNIQSRWQPALSHHHFHVPGPLLASQDSGGEGRHRPSHHRHDPMCGREIPEARFRIQNLAASRCQNGQGKDWSRTSRCPRRTAPSSETRRDERGRSKKLLLQQAPFQRRWQVVQEEGPPTRYDEDCGRATKKNHYTRRTSLLEAAKRNPSLDSSTETGTSFGTQVQIQQTHRQTHPRDPA